MSKLPKILLLLVLMGTIATSQVQRPGPAIPAPVLGNHGPAIGSQDELQQYTAGGHILGFRKGEMFVASGDHALKVEFVNANPVGPIGEGGSANPKKGHEVAPPLGRVTYRDLWDGVTLVYENPGSGVVKSTYHIESEGTGTIDRVDEIRLRYNVPVKVDDRGGLVLSFPMGEMRESRPVAWQEIEGKRVPVDATYRLISGQEVGFKAGSYDPRYSLVIDPALSWNAFLGGSFSDYGNAIALDTNGNVYVAGTSNATWGSPVRPFAGGGSDAFVAKLNGSGVLQWNSFLGSSSADEGWAIAVDNSGNIYVAGESFATWGSPVRPYAGAQDAFAAKLNGSGVLQWHTFMGQLYYDWGYAIAVDTSGNVYIAGDSVATWGSPVRSFAGIQDAFAAKLNGNGALQWNTFLGSSNYDDGRSIAVDTSGNVYVAGTSSATWGSPTRLYAGGYDAFAAKLNGSGALQWNAFLGGSGQDIGNALAMDTSGNVYVAGESEATWGSPANPYIGGVDAFAAKLNGSGTLQWNTFLGSSNDDHGYAIAVDTSGNIFVSGDSGATWGSPVLPFMAGGYNAFAAKIGGSGVLQWNAFLGASAYSANCDIAVDTSGNVYVTGMSYTTWGSPIIPFAGSYDAFVAKLLNSNVKNDFNGDGQDDILWRYYGPGGLNVVWEMGTGSGTAPALGSQAKDNGGMNLLGGQEPGRIYWSPLEAGGLLSKRPARSYRSAMEVGLKREIAAVYQAPWEVWGKGKGTKILASPMEGMTQAQTAPNILASVPLYPVADTNWEIVGVGDFNGDGKPDILWRNYGTAGWTGTNVVWYMNGTTIAGQDLLYTVTDPNWRIVGVGDFNGDGKADIVWRNSGTGMDVVWYMNGAAIAGQDVLYTVANPNWKIVGVGDFSGDGKPDILWRDSGTGMNVVWYMNGAAISGQDVLYTVADANWRIEGVGDYNGDGKPDILWRNYGSGGWTGTNLVWYMNGATLTGQDLLYTVTDLSWRIVIH